MSCAGAVGCAAPAPLEFVSASDGTDVVGVAADIDSVVETLLPSNMYPCGSGPSFEKNALRAAGIVAGLSGSGNGPYGRGAYAGPPTTAPTNTVLRHCASVDT